MGLLIRTLLIWLLVLAVPAQGAAAATMAFCGPNHHGGGAAEQAQRGPLAERAAHEAAARSTHGEQVMATQADGDTASVKSTAPSNVVHTANQKCSACASCCSFGAILSTVLAVAAPAVADTVFSTVVPTVDTFAADGPDRPPRIALA